MPQISLRVSGRDYDLTCGDGEEAHLHELAAYIDGKVAGLRANGAKGSDAQLLFMASLIIADELSEATTPEKDAPGKAESGPVAEVLEAAAVRLERLAAQMSAT